MHIYMAIPYSRLVALKESLRIKVNDGLTYIADPENKNLQILP